LISSSSAAILIGTMKKKTEFGDYWAQINVAEEAAATAIGTTNATRFYVTNPPGNLLGDASTFTCCPAAISAQVMCPTALQTASGLVGAAVCPVRMDLAGDTRSWNDLVTDFVAYMKPRLMTAGKLALRGVQLDSYPLSMADCSEFLPMAGQADTAGAAWNTAGPRPCGWAPFVIYNQTGAELQILITVEWRVRFDIGNPAVSSHSHHGVTSDVSWDQHLRRAIDLAPGVIDIVEKVANTGMALRAVAALA
jgi:hypothetical protein